MKIDILNRYNNSVIYSGEFNSKKECILFALKSSANLSGANLSRADLLGANLSGANLSRADLLGANLSRANLSRANLSGADLSRADLSGADLSGADLSRAVNYSLSVSRTRICQEGNIIGWKKCKNNVIVKLLIPEKAKRNNAFSRKCRAEFATVLDISPSGAKAISSHDSKTEYKIGEAVHPDSFSEKFWEECAPGIHFFITREEAENY